MTDNLPLHPVTLRFREPEIEASFREDYAQKSLSLVRAPLILGFFLYALFGLLDPWIVPEAVDSIRVIRIAECVLLFFTYFVTYSPLFRRHTQLILALLAFIIGAGIVAMVLVADEEGGHHYYAGLILVFSYAFGLNRLRFINASRVCWSVIAAYELVAILVKSTPVYLLLNNTFFLVGACLIGMMTAYVLEFNERKVFWQKRMLDEQRRELDAEHDRKTKELEAARRLQVHMLPRNVPEHTTADFAVSMKTASEVGGDYYDFWKSDDGTVTIAIGDATGHGAQAGVMVAAAKAVITTLVGENDLAGILEKASATIGSVGNSKSFMALALVRLRGSTLELAGAGMPPALIYRPSTGSLEQIPLKGAPLGCPRRHAYSTSEAALGAGDTVVLMSDGFAESFSVHNEMFGYDRAAITVGETGQRSPQQIITHLENTASAWLGGQTQRDDMTFVVVKAKTPVGAARGALQRKTYAGETNRTGVAEVLYNGSPEQRWPETIAIPQQPDSTPSDRRTPAGLQALSGISLS